MLGFFLLGSILIFCGFVLSVGRFLNCLIVLENFKVLLLFCSLIFWWESHVLFLALVVIFTVEVTLSLVVLTRLWDYGLLRDVISF